MGFRPRDCDGVGTLKVWALEFVICTKFYWRMGIFGAA